jgi:hypothetical protein
MSTVPGWNAGARHTAELKIRIVAKGWVDRVAATEDRSTRRKHDQFAAPDKSAIIARICTSLAAGDTNGARAIARHEYPFISVDNAGRKYSEHQMMAVFIRDGFVDRYSGRRLVLPGALRLLSKVLPEEFPFHANWKMSESHLMWWELCPTVDHVVPVARGGKDDESNWVTTSMMRNSAKANWTLEELGWIRLSDEQLDKWDRLTNWFVAFLAKEPERRGPYIRRWELAALRSR